MPYTCLFGTMVTVVIVVETSLLLVWYYFDPLTKPNHTNKLTDNSPNINLHPAIAWCRHCRPTLVLLVCAHTGLI